MVHTRSSANRSVASVGHSTVSSNPFDDPAIPHTSEQSSVIDPNASTASNNPFDVFEVSAGRAQSVATNSIQSHSPNDQVLSELRRILNANMTRALEALTLLTSAHSSNPVAANKTPDQIFSTQAPSPPSQPVPVNDDDHSVADSITSGISISSIRTGKTLRDAVQDMFRDTKSKSIKLPSLEDRLHEPSNAPKPYNTSPTFSKISILRTVSSLVPSPSKMITPLLSSGHII